eukprot:3504952-Rhodomonas_salina.1
MTRSCCHRLAARDHVARLITWPRHESYHRNGSCRSGGGGAGCQEVREQERREARAARDTEADIDTDTDTDTDGRSVHRADGNDVVLLA